VNRPGRATPIAATGLLELALRARSAGLRAELDLAEPPEALRQEDEDEALSWKYMVGLSWARQCRHCGMKQKVRRRPPRAADLEKTTIAETLTIWPDGRRAPLHDPGPCFDAPAEESRRTSASLWTYELATQAAELLAGIASPPWTVGLTEAEDEEEVLKVLRAAYRSGTPGPVWMVGVPDRDAPMEDTGVYIAITGNGRSSRAHAEFIAAAPDLLAAAMAEIERQREEFERPVQEIP
jgi:hypothetical protein